MHRRLFILSLLGATLLPSSIGIAADVPKHVQGKQLYDAEPFPSPPGWEAYRIKYNDVPDRYYKVRSYDEDALLILQTVNVVINQYPYATDLEVYNKTDVWDNISEKGKGDCDSYATEKRALLIKMGWPKSSLRLATCFMKEGYHCVLTVDMFEKDKSIITVMLDNNSNKVIPWQDAPYLWEARQAATGSGWNAIKLR